MAKIKVVLCYKYSNISYPTQSKLTFNSCIPVVPPDITAITPPSPPTLPTPPSPPTLPTPSIPPTHPTPSTLLLLLLLLLFENQNPAKLGTLSEQREGELLN